MKRALDVFFMMVAVLGFFLAIMGLLAWKFDGEGLDLIAIGIAMTGGGVFAGRKIARAYSTDKTSPGSTEKAGDKNVILDTFLMLVILTGFVLTFIGLISLVNLGLKGAFMFFAGLILVAAGMVVERIFVVNRKKADDSNDNDAPR